MLRQTTKAVDAAPRRARSLMPEPRRPGWADAPRIARSVLAVPGMLALHERLEHAAARPVIVPEMIVCDHGSVDLSQTVFRPAMPGYGLAYTTHLGQNRGGRNVDALAGSSGSGSSGGGVALGRSGGRAAEQRAAGQHATLDGPAPVAGAAGAAAHGADDARGEG
jgi:hypothetical protein